MADSGFKDHFSGHAVQYATYRPAYPNSLFTYLASLTPDHDSAWDCATGTGQSAKVLAAHYANVIATDASAQQVANAAADPRIDYRVEPSERTSIRDSVIDLITVAQALHWFDIPAFYREAKRVLKEGGVVAVWSYNLLRISPALDAVIDKLYWKRLGGYWPPERRLIEQGYRGIGFPFEELGTPNLTMSADWTFDQLVGYLGTWSAVQRCKQASGVDPIAAIKAPLAEAWGRSVGERKVVWPLRLRVGKYAS